MIENKYYVPDVTEFRIGFEYELDGLKLQYDICHEYPLDILNDFIYTDKVPVRVKYLNQEDIESFGFEFIRKDELCEIFTACRTREEIYRLEYTSKISLVRIGIYDSNNTVELGCVFNGIIKNKYELQVLLKQLVIN